MRSFRALIPVLLLAAGTSLVAARDQVLVFANLTNKDITLKVPKGRKEPFQIHLGRTDTKGTISDGPVGGKDISVPKFQAVIMHSDEDEQDVTSGWSGAWDLWTTSEKIGAIAFASLHDEMAPIVRLDIAKDKKFTLKEVWQENHDAAWVLVDKTQAELAKENEKGSESKSSKY